MCARRKQSVIFKIDRTMNYFLLAETDFFRLINEAGDCNMETAYTAFATQVIELCIGSPDTNRTIIAWLTSKSNYSIIPCVTFPKKRRK